MILAKEGEWKKKIDDFSFVEGMFRSIEDEEFVHFKLTNDHGHYIECQGSRNKLILSFTRQHEDKNETVFLGVSKEDRGETSIPFETSFLTTRKNEILMLEDAQICFRAFYEDKPFPNAFNQRIV